jgi:hypothetical protein
MTPPDAFDLTALDLRLNGAGAVKVELAARHRRPRNRFLPALPEQTFRQLIQLPRRAWAVYCALLLRCRLERKKTVVLTTYFLSQFGLTRTDKSRALPRLERAGLIRVERHSRHNPTVTLLPTPEES